MVPHRVGKPRSSAPWGPLEWHGDCSRNQMARLGSRGSFGGRPPLVVALLRFCPLGRANLQGDPAHGALPV